MLSTPKSCALAAAAALLCLCGPASAQGSSNCPNVGVTVYHPESIEVGPPMPCRWGISSFTWGNVTINWSKPSCPSFLKYTPQWNETGSKVSFRIAGVLETTSLIFFFHCCVPCKACVMNDTRGVMGPDRYRDIGCDIQPPPPPPSGV